MSKIGYGILAAVGLVLIIGGSVFLGVFPGILKKKVEEDLVLSSNDSEAYDRWIDKKNPITLKFYVFDLNNSETFKSLDDIQLVEKGPYSYAETRIKQQVSYSNDGNLLTYVENRTYVFDPNQSDGKDSDELTFINFPILGLALNKVLGPFATLIYNNNVGTSPSNETTLFIKRPVIDLLFDGIYYTVFQYTMGKIRNPYAVIDLGLQHHPNKTDSKTEFEPEWTIYTGKNDINQLGEIHRFDKKDNLTNEDRSYIWNNAENEACTKLRGTDGTMFKPAIEKSDILYAFEPQLCRSVYFYFKEEIEVKGIQTYRFVVPVDYFKSPQDRPENACYSHKPMNESSGGGLLDISQCQRMTFGAPIVMSAPYFKNANEETKKEIAGNIKPKKELNDENYSTILDIEPITGTVLRAYRRMQMNVRLSANEVKKGLKTMPKLKALNGTRDYVVPVLWVEETAEVNDENADLFKSMVTNKKKLANGLSIGFIVVGALVTVSAVYLFLRNR